MTTTDHVYKYFGGGSYELKVTLDNGETVTTGGRLYQGELRLINRREEVHTWRFDSGLYWGHLPDYRLVLDTQLDELEYHIPFDEWDADREGYWLH